MERLFIPRNSLVLNCMRGRAKFKFSRFADANTGAFYSRANKLAGVTLNLTKVCKNSIFYDADTR